MYYFALPILAYWVIVYPFACLIYMVVNKSQLDDDIILRIRMGYYLNGYKSKYFYWLF